VDRYGVVSNFRAGMKVVIITLLMGSVVFLAPASQACEKHLEGHQGGSDTSAEVQQSGEGQRR
jgi:hypothetical protein